MNGRKYRLRDLVRIVVRRKWLLLVPFGLGLALAPTIASGLRVAFVSNDRETARKVTERLASLYIEQNRRDGESQAQSPNQFLETQLPDAKERLVEHEKKFEEYLQRYAGPLTSQLRGNLQAIQNAQLQLQSINESMARATERRLLIERQMADAQALLSSPNPAANVASALETSQSLNTAQQLAIARARLQLSKLRFIPDGPEVLSLQRAVADLQMRLEHESPIGGATSDAERTPTPLEAAPEKRLGELGAELDMLRQQLSAGHAEATRLKEAIAGYQAQVDVVPARESELIGLMRDYSTLQTAYTTLLTKRDDSQTAANLQRRRIAEQFQVKVPASLPERPSNEGQRWTMISAGPVGGLLFGLFLVSFLEFRDTTFRREEDVVRVLTVPVLALIPAMTSDRKQQAQHRGVGGGYYRAAAAVLAFWRI